MTANTGCSINVVFFSNFLKIFQTLFSLVSVCVHKQGPRHKAGRKPALQQNWQSSEKSQNFKEKTQYLRNTLIPGTRFKYTFRGIPAKLLQIKIAWVLGSEMNRGIICSGKKSIGAHILHLGCKQPISLR